MTNRQIRVTQGTISYRDLGSGPTPVFVHGVFANGRLWDAVLPRLTGQFRCIFRYRQLSAHLPGGMWLVAQTLRVPALRRSPLGFGWLGKRVPDELLADWVRPVITDRSVRRDGGKFLRGVRKRYQPEAVASLIREFAGVAA